jgi:regulator of sirC expression with transglutaminase-like and TPR domain
VSFHEYLQEDPQCRQLAVGAVAAVGPLLPDPDPGPVTAQLDAWAFELAGRMPLPWNLHEAMDALNDFLFRDLGFKGDPEGYEDPENAVLPSVLARRKGLPLTLSILWIDLARRLGLDAVGVGLPGHFIVGLRLEPGLLLYDPFHGGRAVGEERAAQLVRSATGGRVAFEPGMLSPVTHRAILYRLLRNLYVRFARTQSWDDALWAATHMILIHPAEAQPYRDRTFVRIQRGELDEALRDLKDALRLSPKGDAELEGWLEKFKRNSA